MKNILVAALVAIGMVTLPALAAAAAYKYVDCTGNVRMVEADNEAAALVLAPDIAMHSGVILADEAEEIPVGTDVAVVPQACPR